MKSTIKGLIIKSEPFKENDLMITALSRERGKINILARGANKGKRGKMCYQTFAYTEFEIYEGKGMAVADDAEVIEAFYGLRLNIEGLALAHYLARTVAFVTTDKVDEKLMSLLLNSIFLIAAEETNLDIIKLVFELQFAKIEGFAPNADGCALCGKHVTRWAFARGMLCGECCGGDGFAISVSELSLLKHILSASGRRAYTFTVSNEILTSLNNLTEKYLEFHLEHHFASLDYYKQYAEFRV